MTGELPAADPRAHPAPLPVILPLGDAGWLVDLGSAQQRRAAAVVLGRDALTWPDEVELVPGECTLAALFIGPAEPSRGRSRLAILHTLLAASIATLTNAPVGGASDLTEGSPQPPVVEIEVSYDGPDLAEVASLLGSEPDELVAWHTGQLWRVEFTGFMPGFGYLTADDPRVVPRRTTPRPRIAAGSVGLAGSYSGIYPQASPGGWQVIGRTAAPLWDVRRTPPALLVPDARVRFVDRGAR